MTTQLHGTVALVIGASSGIGAATARAFAAGGAAIALVARRKGRLDDPDMVNVRSTAGRAARAGAAIYNLTKFGVGAFSEALRQEITKRHVRVSLVEPGAVKTELVDHVRPGVREETLERLSSFERLEAEDIADAIVYIVRRHRRIAVNEILIRPTGQEYYALKTRSSLIGKSRIRFPVAW